MPDLRQVQWSRLPFGINLANSLFYGVVATTVAASASFPFYVHYHQHQFGPPLMEFYGSQGAVIADEKQDPVYMRQSAALLRPRLELDRITTGAIARATQPDQKAGRVKPPSQSFPTESKVQSTNLDILFVSTGRLLALENGRILSLKIGQTLSDGTTIQSIKKGSIGWEIRTSGGAMFKWSGKRK